MEELETVKKALNKARSEIEERQRYTEVLFFFLVVAGPPFGRALN